MSGALSALGSLWTSLTTILDPLCGPIGVFSLFGGDGLLSCGDAGWADEIAFGVKVTISLALATLPFGLVFGFLIALAAQSNEKMVRLSAGIFTTIFRGLPELLTLFIVYYGLQLALQAGLAWFGYQGGVEINAFIAGMIALTVVFSAYSSEVLLSAFRAIPNGQYEAGASLGLSKFHTMCFIILPQLVRIALPGMSNLWLMLLKDTAYVSVIGLSDIIRQTGVAARVTKEAFLFYGIACALFLVLALLSSIFLGYLDRWARKSEASR
jgi:polar amino acid transport system permease protein